MSRFNLKSIFSWVDSHIIDYSTAMIFLQNARMSILVFCFSSYLLFFVSPIFGILSLLIFTVYLLYNKNFEGIYIIWGSFFIIWYLVFTACLIGYDGPILFTPDFLSDEDAEARGYFYISDDGNEQSETHRLMYFIMDQYSYCRLLENLFNLNLKGFCMQTFYILCWISLNLKVTIYLPSLLKGILSWGGFYLLFSVLFFVWGRIKSIFGR